MLLNNGFLKLNRKAAEYLIGHEPECYLLLTQIALRAKRTNNELNHLEIGQAMIGDYKKCSLTHRKYRTALTKLEKMKLVTTKTTNKGTRVTLLDTRAFDINIEDDRQTKRQTSDKQATTNKNKEERINKNKINTNVVYSENFLNFYSLYPRKEGKKVAFEAWVELDPNDELISTILIAVKNQLKAGMFDLREHKKYCAFPLTWLNQRRWENEVEEGTKKPEEKYEPEKEKPYIVCRIDPI